MLILIWIYQFHKITRILNITLYFSPCMYMVQTGCQNIKTFYIVINNVKLTREKPSGIFFIPATKNMNCCKILFNVCFFFNHYSLRTFKYVNVLSKNPKKHKKRYINLFLKNTVISDYLIRLYLFLITFFLKV